MNNETRFWSFTWATCIAQKKLPERGKLAKFLNRISKTCTFQLECGKVRKKKHYQGGFVLLGERRSKKKLLDLFKSHFKNVAGLTIMKAHNMEAVMKYSSKEDTRLEGPFVVGQKEIWDEDFSNAILKSWQKDLFEFLKINSKNKILRDRKILWVQDPFGNSGKSFFQKWLRIGQHELKARKLPVSSVERLISAVSKVLALENNKIDIFMVDITKSRGREESLDDLLASLEQLKNGFVVDTMYGKYVEVIFKPPIVIVFTNESFREYRDRLTDDRWLPLHIRSDQQVEVLEFEKDDLILPQELKNYKIK